MHTLPLQNSDAELMQRVIRHVLEAQVEDELPRIDWNEGLHATHLDDLRARWPLLTAAWDELARRTDSTGIALAVPNELLLSLRDLLFDHRAQSDPVLTVLANMIASACFGSHHLWQDLGAVARNEVSRLLKLGFPELHASNVHNLRWKRHLFLVLGERLGRAGLRPPKCDACDDFETCFDVTEFADAERWPLTSIR